MRFSNACHCRYFLLTARQKTIFRIARWSRHMKNTVLGHGALHCGPFSETANAKARTCQTAFTSAFNSRLDCPTTSTFNLSPTLLRNQLQAHPQNQYAKFQQLQHHKKEIQKWLAKSELRVCHLPALDLTQDPRCLLVNVLLLTLVLGRDNPGTVSSLPNMSHLRQQTRIVIRQILMRWFGGRQYSDNVIDAMRRDVENLLLHWIKSPDYIQTFWTFLSKPPILRRTHKLKAEEN